MPTIIRKQNEINVYVEEGQICIQENDAVYNGAVGMHVDAVVRIDIAHVDDLIEGLKKIRQEIALEGNEMGNG